MPIAESDTEQPNSITLLYMVLAGNHDIVIVVDPDNVIVETDESIDSNMRKIPGGKMSSTLGVVDVGVDVIAIYSVPVIILGATFSLVGVAGYVIYGRRIAAISRFAEMSSLLPGMEDEGLRF